jgi:predicted DNA-binding ribbon-helix-helix protein
MRTTLELPDPLFKHLKAMAALEGRTLRELVITLVERGLQAAAQHPIQSTALPSISLGAPLALEAHELSNASLARYLDE